MPKSMIRSHHGYPLLVFSLGALLYGVAPVLKIGTLFAQSIVGVAIALGGLTVIVGLVQMWRHG